MYCITYFNNEHCEEREMNDTKNFIGKWSQYPENNNDDECLVGVKRIGMARAAIYFPIEFALLLIYVIEVFVLLEFFLILCRALCHG